MSLEVYNEFLEVRSLEEGQIRPNWNGTGLDQLSVYCVS